VSGRRVPAWQVAVAEASDFDGDLVFVPRHGWVNRLTPIWVER
jgi:hypothetical protein